MNYKKILTIPLTFLSMTTLSFATIYSNAEGGNTDSWHVYDNTPSGATISNVIDDSKKSNVIELKGKARFNSYMLGNKDWDNSTEKHLKWSMKFSEKFKITVYLSTQKGLRTLFYDYRNYDKGLYKTKYIKIGLGSKSRKGTWQSFSRNIEADLKKYEPDNELLSINGFKVQGSGRIDDVELFTPDNTSVLEISNIKVKNISDTYVKVSWSLNHKGTGQIEYGTTSNYGTFSKKESSFTYNVHRQSLRKLKPNTTYHYRVISEGFNGKKVVSEDQTFSTGDFTPPVNPCITRNELIDKINNNEDVTKVNTSCIKDMSSLFMDSAFNQNIGQWDVSNVTNMNKMFYYAKEFNQDIGEWNVSKVTNMSEMFVSAVSFNQNINNWDVSHVEDMSYMFSSTYEFNQKLENWDVSKVTNMNNMFIYSAFNQSIGQWDVSNVITMKKMFSYTRAFNQNINNWDVSNVQSMEDMFLYSKKFNQPLNNWNVSHVKNMESMFSSAQKFNQDLKNWDVSNVTNMAGMFEFSKSFTNHDLRTWNVRNVLNHDAFFKYSEGYIIQPNWTD